MTVGTRSVIFGAHSFFLHPFFVAAAWWKLYGFPWDPRLWAAFFLHDIGYLGCRNMDGPEGEAHVELGAQILSKLFDRYVPGSCCRIAQFFDRHWGFGPPDSHYFSWYCFSLYHSRYYAKRDYHSPSRLCYADKLSFVLTPWWLYLPMVTATGEIKEYLKNAQTADSAHWTPTGYDKRKWHSQLRQYMRDWVEQHKDGAADTWTDASRNQPKERMARL